MCAALVLDHAVGPYSACKPRLILHHACARPPLAGVPAPAPEAAAAQDQPQHTQEQQQDAAGDGGPTFADFVRVIAGDEVSEGADAGGMAGADARMGSGSLDAQTPVAGLQEGEHEAAGSQPGGSNGSVHNKRAREGTPNNGSAAGADAAAGGRVHNSGGPGAVEAADGGEETGPAAKQARGESGQQQQQQCQRIEGGMEVVDLTLSDSDDEQGPWAGAGAGQARGRGAAASDAAALAEALAENERLKQRVGARCCDCWRLLHSERLQACCVCGRGELVIVHSCMHEACIQTAHVLAEPTIGTKHSPMHAPSSSLSSRRFRLNRYHHPHRLKTVTYGAHIAYRLRSWTAPTRV